MLHRLVWRELIKLDSMVLWIMREGMDAWRAFFSVGIII